MEPAQLYAWRAEAQQQGEDVEAQRLQQSESARLKREVARLKEKVAFLKKAAAYFAKQPKRQRGQVDLMIREGRQMNLTPLVRCE